MVKPYDSFDSRVYGFYWMVIPYNDNIKTVWTCWHMFRPYNHNIFKVGMKSEYFLKKNGGRFLEEASEEGSDGN